MKIAYGSSKTGDVSEALKHITEPAALLFSVNTKTLKLYNKIKKRIFLKIVCARGRKYLQCPPAVPPSVTAYQNYP